MNNNCIIPAIDIMNGQLVRLTQGDYARQTIYDKDPLTWARTFEQAGIERLHIVDLDGAKAGKIKNLPVLHDIAKHTSLQIDFGGGVKTTEDVISVLDAGASMISVGSIAVKNPGLLSEWMVKFGAEKFFIGADVKQENLMINGWKTDSGIDIFNFIEGMIQLGAVHFFCTDILKDGALQGTSVELYRKISSAFPAISLTASGGVSCMADIIAAQEAGCKSVIVGKAIYEGKITVAELKAFNDASIKSANAL